MSKEIPAHRRTTLAKAMLEAANVNIHVPAGPLASAANKLTHVPANKTQGRWMVNAFIDEVGLNNFSPRHYEVSAMLAELSK